MMRLNDRNRRLLGWAVFALACAVSVLIYALLPDTLALQVTSGGQAGNTAPKLLYIALFTAAELVITLLNHFGGGGTKSRWLLISVILCAVNAVTLILNLTTFKGAF